MSDETIQSAEGLNMPKPSLKKRVSPSPTDSIDGLIADRAMVRIDPEALRRIQTNDLPPLYGVSPEPPAAEIRRERREGRRTSESVTGYPQELLDRFLRRDRAREPLRPVPLVDPTEGDIMTPRPPKLPADYLEKGGRAYGERIRKARAGEGPTGKPEIDVTAEVLSPISGPLGETARALAKDMGADDATVEKVGQVVEYATSGIGALPGMGVLGASVMGVSKAAKAAGSLEGMATKAIPRNLDAIADKAYRLGQSRGGATINIAQDGAVLGPKQGFSVSVAPELEKRIPGRASKDEIRSFIETNRETFEDQRANLGVWYSKDTDETVLDVSILTRDSERAMEAGRPTGQQAIYDFGTQADAPVPYVTGPHPYTKSAEPLTPQDVEIARTYDQAQTDPALKPSWDSLAAETELLYADLPVKVKKVTGQPYATAADMAKDVKENGVLKVTTDNSEHPFWSVDQNFKFRAVHDYHGHILQGHDFSLRGEHRAWLAHQENVKDAGAHTALKTEVYGQAASAIANAGFQAQKAVDVGKAGDLAPLQQRLALGDIPQPSDFERNIRLERYQNEVPEGGMLDPANPAHRAGVMRAAEERRFGEDFLPRLNYYREGARPERSKDYSSPAIGRYRLTSEVDPSRLYDVGEDPLGLWQSIGRDKPNQVEQELRKRGFAGFYNSSFPDATMSNSVAMFEPLPILRSQDLSTGEISEGLSNKGMALLAGGLGAASMGGEQDPDAPLQAGISAGNLPLAGAAALAAYLSKGKLPHNSKQFGGLASIGAADIHTGVAPNRKAFEAAMRARFGNEVAAGLQPHMDALYDASKEQYRKHLKGTVKAREIQGVLKYFHGGAEYPDWYGATDSIAKQYGRDADLFAGLLAATSAHTPVERNADYALKAYEYVKTGRVAEITKANPDFMETHVPNILRAIGGEDLHGNKVHAFKRALLGDEDAVVIDTHMVRAILGDSIDPAELSDARYATAEQMVRTYADMLGVTPRYAQQAIWIGRKLELGLKEGEVIEPILDTIIRLGQEADVFNFFSDKKTLVRPLALGALAVMVAQEGEKTGDTSSETVQTALQGIGLAALLPPQVARVIAENARRLGRLPAALVVRTATAEEMVTFVATGTRELRVGTKLMAIDWNTLHAGGADAIRKTTQRLKETFDVEGVHETSRGVVTWANERQMVKELEELGFDAQAVLARQAGEPASSTEIMAAATFYKAAVQRLNELDELAEAGIRGADEAFAQQMGVTAAILKQVDGMGEEAGRALNAFRAVIGETQTPHGDFLRGYGEMQQQGLVPPAGAIPGGAAPVAASTPPPASTAAVAGAPASPAATPPASGATPTRGGGSPPPGGSGAQPPAGGAPVRPNPRALRQAYHQLPQPVQRTSFTRAVATHGYDFIMELFYDAWLMNVKTQLASLAGNIIMTAEGPLVATIAAGWGNMRRLVTGGEALPMNAGVEQVHGMFAALGEAFSAAWSSFRTGQPVINARTPHLDAISSARVNETLSALSPNLRVAHPLAVAIDALGFLAGIGTRGLLAGDQFFQVINRSARLHEMALVAGRQLGHTGDNLRTFISQYVANPPVEANRVATAHARYTTMQEPFGGTLGHLQNAARSPLFWPFVPFFGVAANMGRVTFEHLPGLNMAVARSRNAIMAGGPEADVALTKVALGTTALALGGYLYFSGKITGRGPTDPNMKREMEEMGWKPHAWVSEGADGKKTFYPLNRLEPVVTPFMLAADTMDIFTQMGGDEMSWEARNELAAAAVLALMENFTSKTWMSNFREALEAFTAKDDTALERTVKFGKRFLAPVPGIVREVARTQDPIMRETYSYLDEWRARLPGYSKDLYPKRKTNGEPRIIDPSLGPDWASIFPYSEGKPDIVSRELVLNDVGISEIPKSLGGSMPGAIGQVEIKDGVALTPKQRDEYARLAGNELKIPAKYLEPGLRAMGYDGPLPGGKAGMWDLLTMVVQSSEYKKLTSGEGGGRADVLRKVVNGFREAARGHLLLNDQELRDRFLQKTLDRVERKGGPEARQQAEGALSGVDWEQMRSMSESLMR